MQIVRSLTAQDFEKEFGSIHRSIFSREWKGNFPFVAADWELILIPYGCHMDEHDFRGLVFAAECFGDQEIIIADVETEKPTEAAVVIEASFPVFESLKSRPNSNFAIIDIHMFGKSGVWGCICAASLDDVAILGGQSSFMGSFFEAGGGLNVLRNRFRDFASTEWSIEDEERSRLLRLVGWEAAL